MSASGVTLMVPAEAGAAGIASATSSAKGATRPSPSSLFLTVSTACLTGKRAGGGRALAGVSKQPRQTGALGGPAPEKNGPAVGVVLGSCF